MLTRILQYIYKNITPLNATLILAIVATLILAVMPLLNKKMKFTLPVVKVKPVVEEQTDEDKKQAPTPLDYVMIGENNLFHPERRIPPEKKEEKQLPKPELVLYGTIIHEGVTVAYVEDKKAPKTTPGRGDRQQVVKKGAVFSGFVLKDIETDRIVLTRGDEVMVVHLSDETKRRGGDGGKAGTAKATPAAGASARPTPAGGAPGRVNPGTRVAAPAAIPPPGGGGPGTVQNAPPGQPFSRASRGQAPIKQ